MKNPGWLASREGSWEWAHRWCGWDSASCTTNANPHSSTSRVPIGDPSSHGNMPEPAGDGDHADEHGGEAAACPICRGPARSPYTTSCGHQFCGRCLAEHWWRQHFVAPQGPRRECCPLCRQVVLQCVPTAWQARLAASSSSYGGVAISGGGTASCAGAQARPHLRLAIGRVVMLVSAQQAARCCSCVWCVRAKRTSTYGVYMAAAEKARHGRCKRASW